MTVSDIDRLGEVATRLIGSVARYAEEAAVRLTGKERAEVEAAARQARAIGELTVLMSTAKVKSFLANLNETETETETPASSDIPEVVVSVPPLPDYDSLTAPQIVAMMESLSPEERAVVVAYEEQHRRRSTIIQGNRR